MEWGVGVRREGGEGRGGEGIGEGMGEREEREREERERERKEGGEGREEKAHCTHLYTVRTPVHSSQHVPTHLAYVPKPHALPSLGHIAGYGPAFTKWHGFTLLAVDSSNMVQHLRGNAWAQCSHITDTACQHHLASQSACTITDESLKNSLDIYLDCRGTNQ